MPIVRHGIQVSAVHQLFNSRAAGRILIRDFSSRMGQLECKSKHAKTSPAHVSTLIGTSSPFFQDDTQLLMDGSLVGRLPLHAVRGTASQDGYAHFQGQVLEYG